MPGRRDRDRDLGRDLQRLKTLGVDQLVCLVGDDELAWAGVADLADRTKAQGIAFRHSPIKDQGVPALAEAIVLVRNLISDLNQGRRTVLNCRAGLGRAGTIAACFLVANGWPVDEAIAEIRRLRDPRAIETAGQEQFIAQFAETWPC